MISPRAKDMAKKAAHVAGTAIVLGSLVFIGIKIYNARNLLGQRHFGPGVFAALAEAAAGYALACIFLAMGWTRLLDYTSGQKLSGPKSRRIYARTQIAKYAPGNVFHFVSRHALGTREGWSQAAMVASATYEIFFVVAASSLVAFIGLADFGVSARNITQNLCLALCGLFLAAPFSLHILSAKIPRLRAVVRPANSWREAMTGLFAPYLCYVFHGLVSGAMLMLVAGAFSPVHGSLASGAVITTFGLAWLAGFITPGAPAGMGARETVIVLALAPLYGNADSLLIALAFRLVTLAGDVLFFLWSYTPVHRNKTPLAS